MTDPAKKTARYPIVASRIPEGLAWQYRITVRGGYDTHTWSLSGPRGGIHVEAREDNLGWRGKPWIGGVEGHSPIAREHECETPCHEHCWLLDGPCWHDGSSLQFSEQIAPYLSDPGKGMDEGDHLTVLSVMLGRYNSWLPQIEAVERAKGGVA